MFYNLELLDKTVFDSCRRTAKNIKKKKDLLEIVFGLAKEATNEIDEDRAVTLMIGIGKLCCEYYQKHEVKENGE